jgi:HPt (histidine-containing phosphotransfer) domain-containing protein
MTAAAFEIDRQRCFSAGMDDYISKPVNIEDLAAIIERWTPTGSAREETTKTNGAEDRGDVIDVRAMASLRALNQKGDGRLLEELIDSFIADTPRQLVVMREAIAQGDATSLYKAAHLLKGSSGSLGARRAVDLCDIIEQQGRAGSLASASGLVAVLEEELVRVQQALEAEKKRLAHTMADGDLRN